VELLTLKEFMAQWFTILMQKIDTIEKSNQQLVERIDGGGGGGATNGVSESKSIPTTITTPNEIRHTNPVIGHLKAPRKRPPTNVLNSRINFLLNRAQAQLEHKPHENGGCALLSVTTNGRRGQLQATRAV
jgi:hypothetical protein